MPPSSVTRTRRTAPLGLLFLGGVAIVLGTMDALLARRVGTALDLARAALTAPLPHTGAPPASRAPTTFILEPIEADLCNALTGGVWFSWLLPRTRRAMAFDDLATEPAGGVCRRSSSSNGVVFRVAQRPAPGN